MANRQLTDEEKERLYQLIGSKANEPGITYDDLYIGITDIQPSYKKEICCWSISIVIASFLSLYAVIFKPSASNWYVCGLIGYILSSLCECGILFHYKKRLMSIISMAISIFVGYIAINRTIDAKMLESLLQIIKGVFS